MIDKADTAPAQGTRRCDSVFILLSFLASFALCQFVLFGGFGIGVPIFVAVFYIIAAAYLKPEHNIFNKTALLTFIPVFLLLLCFVLFDNTFLRVFNVFALIFGVALNVLAMAGLENRPIFWAGTFLDILKAMFYFPFHKLGERIKAFSSGFKTKTCRNICIVIVTLFVISPVVIIVLMMLASSDAGFESLLNEIAGIFTESFWEYFFKILLSLLLTFPLFNLLYNLRHQERSENKGFKDFLRSLSLLDHVATASALTVFIVIYVFYIVLQAKYLFSALFGVLPESFTYAEYARRGFFELTGVVFINFCLIALAVVVTRRKNGALSAGCRIPALILAGCTLLLIVTAASKMLMYIGNYGLTPLRVYTSWFMLLMLVLMLFVAIKLVVPRFDFYRFSAVGSIILYLALNFCNVDSMIARYNISVYRQTGELDTYVFYRLSDSAVPDIVALKDDGKYGSDIKLILNERRNEIARSRWEDYSVAKALARREIN